MEEYVGNTSQKITDNELLLQLPHDSVSRDIESITNFNELRKLTSSLEKARAVLQEAILAGDQLCFEYDPRLHTLNTFTPYNNYNMPDHLENYPDVFLDSDFFHPEDVEKARAAIKRVDAGEDNVSVELRVKRADRYDWNLCVYSQYFDSEKNYSIAICNVTDITLQKEALLLYQKHLDSTIRLDKSTIATVSINLTQNKCIRIISPYDELRNLQKRYTVDSFFDMLSEFIASPDDLYKYHAEYSRNALISAFNAGKSIKPFDIRCRLTGGVNIWVECDVEMVKNPDMDEIECMLYIRNINSRKLSSLALKHGLEKDYIKMVVLYEDSSDYYLYDKDLAEYVICHRDFWTYGISVLLDVADASEKNMLQNKLTRSNVLSELHYNDAYAVTFRVFNGKNDDNITRYQVFFKYIDRSSGIILINIRDITDSMLLDKLRFDAQHDELTGLYNRSMTFSECERIMDENPDTQFAMCHIDIKKFRLYNSFFGEAAGDRLLKDMAEWFTKFNSDITPGIFGRIESDVFCLFCEYSPENIKKSDAMLQQKLADYKKDFLIEASCGIYVTSENRIPADAMFSRASIAAKNNKQLTLNSIGYYNTEMETTLIKEQRIAAEQQKALDEEQFVIYLQPKYDLSDDTPYGAEALVRWIHPEKGLIPPVEFIPVFEKNGFINKLDQYMWEHVCILLRKWLDEGKKPSPVSVNVSRVSMYNPTTVPFLKSIMKKYRIPAALLDLELTESAYMDDQDEMKNQLLELQKTGFRIMMDDFGSGYSSLNALRELPVDFIKVDMKFLSSMEEDQRSKIVLASVIQMALMLDIPVITEGVETKEQKRFLAETGCNYAQGYLFARPMPVENYEKLVFKTDK